MSVRWDAAALDMYARQQERRGLCDGQGVQPIKKAPKMRADKVFHARGLSVVRVVELHDGHRARGGECLSGCVLNPP